VKGYVKLISDKRYEEALHLILEKNPFPGICGRICTHPCEEVCSPGMDTGPIPIKELKRFAADYELSRRRILVNRNPIRYPEKIAIIGAGPAGLTTAFDLSKYGYDVTVFERGLDPGGMLTQCIPRYRLPKEIVDFEIEYIKRKGVRIVTSCEIENLDSMFESGYSTVILALGAQKDRRLSIPGSDLPGVLECLPFLRDINFGNRVVLNGRVIVIGGGSSAFDAARTAKRIGADKVTIAYRRTENEMAANNEEIYEAKEEGIEIIILALPEEITGKGRVEAVRFLKTTLGEADSSGRKNFLPLKDSEFIIPADWIIPAVGYAPDLDELSEGITVTKWGSIKVDNLGRTSKDKVFATGDVVTGPSTVIEAVGKGHRMADIVHSSFRGIKIEEDVLPEMAKVQGMGSVDGKCISADCIHPRERIEDFSEVVLGFKEKDAIMQAQRCRSCGSCYECALCISSCDHGQLYATIGERSFLLKAPSVLRKKVIEGERDWKIESTNRNLPIMLDSLVPMVDAEKCIACGRCEEVCPYNAVRVRLVKEGSQAAVVDPGVCRTCGICITSCLSEALDHGPLSIIYPNKKINSISDRNINEPLIFASHWSVNQEVFNPEILELMNINALSPALMMDGLATGVPGLLIMAPQEDLGNHYLKSVRNIKENVRRARKILYSIGIDPRRIRLERRPWVERDELLREFKEELANNSLGPLKRGPSLLTDSLVMRTMANIDWLSKYPDFPKKNLRISNETSFAYLQRLNAVLEAEGLFVLHEMVFTIERKVKEFQMVLNIFSYADMTKHLSRYLINGHPSEVSSNCIALLRSEEDEKYGADLLKELLNRVPGISVTEVRAKRSGMEWFRFHGDYLGHGSDILKKCEEHGAELLITVTPFSTACLRLLTRRDSWRRSPVEVKDVFTFLSEINGQKAGGVK